MDEETEVSWSPPPAAMANPQHTNGHPILSGEPQSIWVSSDLASDEQTYVTTIHFTDDLSFPMNEGEGIAYVTALLRALGSAEYDAAMLAQLTDKLELPKTEAARMVMILRQRRGTQTFQAGPMTVTPGVSAFTAKPFVRCAVPGLAWQWDPVAIKQHVRHVLETAAAVDYDAAYRAFLIDEMDLEPERALAVVEDIANFRTELAERPGA